MTPRCPGFASSEPRYFPTTAGMSQVLRVRSGLSDCQVRPWSRVFHTVFEAKKSVSGSVGEKRMGCVRMTRYAGERIATGATSCTSPVRRAQRETLPPKTMSGAVEHLRGGRVEPRRPGRAAVDGDDGALVSREQHHAGVVRIDPEPVVVVAAGRAAEGEPGLSAVRRAPADHA